MYYRGLAQLHNALSSVSKQIQMQFKDNIFSKWTRFTTSYNYRKKIVLTLVTFSVPDLHYRQRIELDGQIVELEIIDVSQKPGVSSIQFQVN